jgi:PAS domain S-box-containing protein
MARNRAIIAVFRSDKLSSRLVVLGFWTTLPIWLSSLLWADECALTVAERPGFTMAMADRTDYIPDTAVAGGSRRSAQQLQELLASIVESSEDAIIAKTVDGTITAWTGAAERMYGYSAEEAIGRPIKMIAPEEANDVDLILERIRRGERISHYQTQRKTKDGRILTISLTVSPLRNEQGEITGASIIARDITDAKRAESALRTSEKLATVGRLAATIAHEINNPLEAVSNVLYLLESHPDIGPEGRKYVQLAQQEISRIAHIVKQTLGFHRESPHPVPINMSSLLQSVLDLYRRRTEETGIAVRTRFETPDAVLGFPGEMRQVFSNLIGNAVEAMPSGGKLAVHVRRARDFRDRRRKGVRITVADSGTGISRESMPHIFEPFFTTKGEKGTGLGLWVSQGIIAKHGGSIRVRSFTGPENHGTAFCVFVPDQRDKRTGTQETARVATTREWTS